jgi:2-polyprenyl-3-methyl-5-hydroxy-6-metoxy-1,4-benzoquinol methylase
MVNEFDGKAREWDANPIHTERSEAIAAALQTRVSLNPAMRVLEFGAGTGLLSFLIHEHVGDITLIDTSAGMVKVMQEKIRDRGLHNMHALQLDLETDPFTGQFDLIYSQMVFHHVDNVDAILHKFGKLLKPGGILAIADLYTEDGSFHGEGFTGHMGFDPETLAVQVREAGFTSLTHAPCYTVKRSTADGKTRNFPVFLMTAVKQG